MIEAEGLTKYYGEVRAIHDVSFSIEAGQIVGILGLNGAGKSTVLQILSGALFPTAGTVRIGGLDTVTHADEVRRRVGFLPEEPPLYREMTVEGYLRFVAGLKGVSNIDSRIDVVCEQTNIAHERTHAISTLSHGYRKRVGIAQALVNEPQLLILDEPISGLDPVQIVEIRDLIRSLRGKHTILVSSHILTEISQTCDHLLMLKDGEIVAAGTEDELVGRVYAGAELLLALRGEREAIDAHLSNDPRVTAHSVRHESGGLVEFQVSLNGDDREEVVKGLVEAGFGLRGLKTAEQELESAFLSITGGGAA